MTAAYAYDMINVIDNLIQQNKPMKKQSFEKLEHGVSETIRFPEI